MGRMFICSKAKMMLDPILITIQPRARARRISQLLGGATLQSVNRTRLRMRLARRRRRGTPRSPVRRARSRGNRRRKKEKKKRKRKWRVNSS